MTPLLSVLQDIWAQLHRRRPGRALELEEDLNEDPDDDSEEPPPAAGPFGARRTADGAFGARRELAAAPSARGWRIAPDDKFDGPIGGRHGR